jgi:hypothetical protein
MVRSWVAVAVCLVALVSMSGCGSESNDGTVGADGAVAANGACAEAGDEGCICRAQPREGDVEFQERCSEAGVGERGLCCQGDNYCRCEPVKCGISSISGMCVCGVGVFLSSTVASCDGTAGTCCTQDTGYCYCKDGCENRFANRIVTSCDMSTSAATCSDGETQVSSCQ